jgi:proteasome lid subunit RPN8/RPN11
VSEALRSLGILRRHFEPEEAVEFRIPTEVSRAIVDHAQAEYPKECCGILVGPAGEVRELHRLTNVDPDPVMRYAADGAELLKLDEYVRERDWEFVCIYHSHTHTEAFPSRTDVERALYPDSVYALVTLKDRANPRLRAFNIVDGNIEELGVVETEDTVTEGA